MTRAWEKLKSLLSGARPQHLVEHAELRTRHPPRTVADRVEPTTVAGKQAAPTDDGMALVYEAVERELRAAGLRP
ncbi:hypothetical protein MKK68_10430 [Methylobacterium sp. E-016]|uniref:hypothetical protein n=1 Tax=Methylobacterium sp. E-016 TaxID=2836556 RepID=UPI001FB9574B|nr:hypothetical protein [Methylobacterium sp. E-016]MCJ2076066.1 hypothetical protein [Methylobacterium sp. E-016]